MNGSDKNTDNERRERFRYNRILLSDYEPSDVCSRTRRKYLFHSLKSVDSQPSLPKDEGNENRNGNEESVSTINVNGDFESIIQNRTPDTSDDDVHCSNNSNDTSDNDVQSSNYMENSTNINNSYAQSAFTQVDLNFPDPSTDNISDNKIVEGNDNFISDNLDFSSCSSSDENGYTDHYSDIDSFSENDSENDDAEYSRNNQSFLFNKVVFESSGLTVKDVILLITAFCLRFHLSDEAQLELINLLKICAGPNFNNFNLSKYLMSQCFSLQKENIKYYYYCSECHDKIIYSSNKKEKCNHKNIVCEKCKAKSTITANSSNYFMNINLLHQMKQLLKNNSIVEDIVKNLQIHKNERNSNLVKDVHNGVIYKKIINSECNTEKSEFKLTLNFNTDGAPLTRSGKRTLQVVLNDLTPKLRFRFILLCGILIVNKEPNSNLLNLYISKVLIEQLQELNNKTLTLRINGDEILLRFYVYCGIVDSVCRPIIQNRVLFNGYFGCSWCYQRGLYITSAHGIRYVFDQENINRTKESHTNDVINNKNQGGKIVRGVKGLSILENVNYFDMVSSFPFEYMHSLLLGVTWQIWNEWKSGESPFKIKKKSIECIEKRFLNITPTHDIHRLPRSGIMVGSSKPKASELKSWLLFYSLPCLQGILDESAFNHYLLLVRCAYKLLKTEISREELLECERDLVTFVCYYELYYGQQGMTFNVHSLLHIVESIRQTGSLYANSAFPYESNIYNFKNHISGPKGMDYQIARKYRNINFQIRKY